MINWAKKNWIVLIFVAMVAALTIYNLIKNTDFFDASMSSLISIVAVLLISYYLTQRKNDDRRKLENVDRLLTKIQEELKNKEICDASSEEKIEQALILQRSLGNKLKYYMDYCNEKEKRDAKYMFEEFKRVRELYGNHMNDSEYIRKSKGDFKNILTKIDDKCEELHLLIFK